MKTSKITGCLALAKNPNACQPWWQPWASYWLPPVLLSIGILIMAGDLGSAYKFRLPVIILKFLLPAYSTKEIYQLYLELRKVMHFLAYAALFLVYVRAWRWHTGLSRWQAILVSLLLCLIISGADEGRQSLLTSRVGSLQDVLLDMSGALTAAIAYFPFLRHERS